jgi:O-acetyl-ADP-ribose deacetylase
MCYQNSIKIADDLGCQSISFPAISTGIYSFPLIEATQIALRTVKEMVNLENIKNIFFVCFDDTTFKIYTKIMNE